MFIGTGTLFTYGVLFTPLSTDLGWSRAAISGAQSLASLLTGLLGIVMGGLSDRFGPRQLLTICGFLLGFGYILLSQLNAIWQLYLFYGVMGGIGMSSIVVPLLSTTARWFAKRRGLMTGIAFLGTGLGSIILPPVVVRLIITYGWRTTFIVMGATVLLIIIPAAQFIIRDPRQKGLLPYGATGEEGEESSGSADASLSFHEAAQTRQFWLLCILFITHGIGQGTVIVHSVPYAIDAGISAVLAANIITIIGGTSAASRVLLGSIADRIGNKLILIIGLIPVTAVLFWLMATTELWAFYLAAGIFGFGFGGIVVSQSPIVAELFGMRAHGAIFGMIIFSVTFGIAAGPLMSGTIFDATGSYYLAFLICAIVSVTSLILTSLLKPIAGQYSHQVG